MRKLFKKALACCLVAAMALTCFVGALTVNAENALAGTIVAGNVEVAADAASVEVPVTITSTAAINAAKINVAAAGYEVTDVTFPESADYYIDADDDGSNKDINGGTFLLQARVFDGGFTAADLTVVLVPTGDIADAAVEITLEDVHAANWDEEVVTLVPTNGSITVKAAEPEVPADELVEVSFKHNINFASKLDILIAAPMSAFEGCTEVYAVCTKDIYDVNGNVVGTEETVVTEYDTTVLGGYYAFYYGGTLAKEMGSTVRTVVYGLKADGSKKYTQIDEYSVLTYVNSRLSKTTNQKEITALVDLMAYGAAAQTYFEYNHAVESNLVINKIDSKFLASAGTLNKAAVIDAYTTTPNTGATVALKKNMSFASAIEIIVGFNTTASDLKVKFDYTDLNGNAQTKWVESADFGSSSGLTYASFTEFTALEMDKIVTATLYSGDTPISDTITYSVYSYSVSRLNRTDAFGILIQKMVTYGQSVKAFKA